MPWFFFDFADDGYTLVDEVGVQLDGLHQVRNDARLTLRDAVADAMQRRAVGTITLVVRDHEGQAILRAAVDWMVSTEEH